MERIFNCKDGCNAKSKDQGHAEGRGGVRKHVEPVHNVTSRNHSWYVSSIEINLKANVYALGFLLFVNRKYMMKVAIVAVPCNK